MRSSDSARPPRTLARRATATRRATAWLALAGLGLPGLIGCQSTTTGSLADDDALPPPSLRPPTVIAPAQPPMHVAVLPPPSMLPPRPLKPASKAVVPLNPYAVPAEWIPRARANHWNWIIVHHSDSAFGSASLIDRWHRDRGFDELGYHFVIGNGTNSGDGQIEVGPRWPKQKWGAHDNALDNRFNEQGIGICLVGNFDQQRPTEAQKRSLVKLVSYLMKTYRIPPERVLGHGETKKTNCPGRFLVVNDIRRAVARSLADSGEAIDPKWLADATNPDEDTMALGASPK